MYNGISLFDPHVSLIHRRRFVLFKLRVFVLYGIRGRRVSGIIVHGRNKNVILKNSDLEN